MYARETSPLNQRKLEKALPSPKKERKKWNILDTYKHNLSNSFKNDELSFKNKTDSQPEMTTSFKNLQNLTADEQK